MVPPRPILFDMWIWQDFVEHCYDPNVILAVAPRPYLFLDLGSCHVFVECFDYLSASEYVNMKLIVIRNVIERQYYISTSQKGK